MTEGPARDWLSPRAREGLEAALPSYLRRQRWFGGKARALERVAMEDAIPLPGPRCAALLLVRATYRDGGSETYLLCAASGPADAAGTPVLAEIEGGPLYDGLDDPSLRDGLFRLVLEGGCLQGGDGLAQGTPAPALLAERGRHGRPAASTLGRAEQSNSSIVFEDRWIMKLFRRLEPGVNPELEMCRALTARTDFSHLPPLGGAIAYRPAGGGERTLAVLQGFIPSDGDAWTYSLAEARRFLDAAPDETADILAPYQASARLLGQRVAELHLALMGITDEPDFRPEPFTPELRRRLRDSMLARARSSLLLLRERLATLQPSVQAEAAALLSSEEEILRLIDGTLKSGAGSVLIRLHGDLHLGQVLHAGSDFFIIDFEGEPARPLSERRGKDSVLRDVAGMLRSFSYAAYSALRNDDSPPLNGAESEVRARKWAASAGLEFLTAYRRCASGTPLLPDGSDGLLLAFLTDKALYELSYELNNRPSWVPVPLRGLSEMLESGTPDPVRKESS